MWMWISITIYWDHYDARILLMHIYLEIQLPMMIALNPTENAANQLASLSLPP
jgi:hypothetical protein